jgi:hypothetical protein
MPPGKVTLKIPAGVGWFVYELSLPEKWNGEPEVVFLGAMFAADVWLDGEYLGNHRGGIRHSPFFDQLLVVFGVIISAEVFPHEIICQRLRPI